MASRACADDHRYGDEDCGDHNNDSDRDDYDDRNDYDNYYDNHDESDDHDSYGERDVYDGPSDYDYDEDPYQEEDYYHEEEDVDSAPPRLLSDYVPEPPVAKIKEAILKVMKQENVHPDDIPPEPAPQFPADVSHSKRYFNTKGCAWFSCPQKHHRWPSAHGWCYLDLKKQEIRFRFKQKCKKCDQEAPPEFSLEAVKIMATYAVKQYLKRIGKKVEGSAATREGPVIEDGKPHDEARCGMCQHQGRSCWKK